MQTQEITICSICGFELTEESEQYTMDNECICYDCYHEETIICDHCQTRIWNDDNAGDSDIPLCQYCYDNHYTHCENCNCLLCDSDNAGENETPLCHSCYDYSYTTCEHCNTIIRNDDAYYTDEDDDNEYGPLCYSCYDKHEKQTYIRSYNYKPSPIFHGNSNRFFGVELEIDCGGKYERNAQTLLSIGNCDNNNIYIKSDGSLDNGLEIVTHPMSLLYHQNTMPWTSLLNRALELGYKSHMVDTCGLHIHINRNSFSFDCERQEECIGRVLYFVERFWEELLRFSRRTETQLKRWANRYGYKSNPVDILDTAKRGYGGRYTCVNITNSETIEFRIFRGTLKYNSLIATLQLVSEICNVASSMSDDELKNLSWCSFMEIISAEQYPELIVYLKERRLYINEPVFSEGEM